MEVLKLGSSHAHFSRVAIVSREQLTAWQQRDGIGDCATGASHPFIRFPLTLVDPPSMSSAAIPVVLVNQFLRCSLISNFKVLPCSYQWNYLGSGLFRWLPSKLTELCDFFYIGRRQFHIFSMGAHIYKLCEE